MGLLEDDIARAISDSAKSFTSAASRMISSNQSQSNVDATGTMKQRIKVYLEENKNEIINEIVLSFPVSAALTQARRYYAKNADIESLTNWVLARGLENFRYVPGYENGKLPSQNQQARRIAWGIKNYRGANRRRTDVKQWLHKPFFGLWASYRNEIINRFFDITSNKSNIIIQQALDEK